MAASYEETDWYKILIWYEQLNSLEPSPFNLLNMAVVQLQRKDFAAAKSLLEKVHPQLLEQRAYLYYGTYAEYAYHMGNKEQALHHIDKAMTLVENDAELNCLGRKKMKYETGVG